MTIQIPLDSDLMSWDPENMDAYWCQCRRYDTRAFLSIRQSQSVSQKAFRDMLIRLDERQRNKNSA